MGRCGGSQHCSFCCLYHISAYQEPTTPWQEQTPTSVGVATY